MNSSGVKAVPAHRWWRKLCVCAAVLSAGVPGQTAPLKSFLRSKTQASDFMRPDPGRPSQDLLLKEEGARKADALASFSRGILAEEDADSDEALEAYRKALDLDPGFSELAAKVAMELVRRKSYDQAINVLKDAIKVSPADPGMPLLVSQIYGKYLKKPEPASRYANQVLELDPGNELAFLTLFEAEATQPKKAQLVLERAAKTTNKDPLFWLQLAEIYSRAVLKEDAQGRAQGSAPKREDLEKVNAVFRKALEFDVENRRASSDRESGSERPPGAADAALSGAGPEVLLRVADYYTISRQYKEAIPLYEQMIKLLQANPDAMLPAVQEKLARCCRLAGRTQEAISSLKEMIRQNPLRYESYELLAEIYEEEGDVANALANYQQTLLMNPSQPINYLRVADMLLKTPAAEPGRPANLSKAVDILKEARAKFPEIPQITYSLAIALTQAGHNQEALRAFSECYNDAKSSEPDMLNGTFYFAYGAAAEQAGNLEQAEVMLKKSIEVDPEASAQACNYLGYMWADRGIRLEEASKLILRALEIDPANGAFLDSLGWLYFKKGEYQKALEELKKAAAAIQPEDCVVYEHLGDTYLNLGNSAEALSCWRKALALDTRSAAPAAGKRLQEKISAAAKP